MHGVSASGISTLQQSWGWWSDIFRNLYNSLLLMGNCQDVKENANFSARPSKENRIMTVLQNYSSKNIEPSQKELPIFKKGDFEVSALLDQNNQINGYAVLRRNFTMVFQGEFQRSKKNGYGIQYQDGKVCYQGYFLNDLRDGWGKDDNYQGEFEMGKRNGWGVETLPSSRYEGYWKIGKENGIGVKFYGSVPANYCFDYSIKEAIFSSFDIEVPCQIYLGEWKEGKRSGLGKLRGVDFIYEGEFQEGVFNGKGELTKKNGIKEKGIFENGSLLRE